MYQISAWIAEKRAVRVPELSSELKGPVAGKWKMSLLAAELVIQEPDEQEQEYGTDKS